MKWTLSLILLVILSGVCNCKKKTDYSKYVQKVETIKDFKKLLRTRINVLVLFGSSESVIKPLMEVYGEAGIQSKGTATLLQVDCSSKEGKKLCKKQKAKPDPTVIQHYKDGEYSANYERKFTVKSILAFLKDPTSDGPWEEEDSAQDVVHLHNENEMNKVLKKKKPTLIMFYAPWCGFCKRFKPAFAEAATEMKNKVIFGGVDADSTEASSLRMEYNVTGFPKTVYFENGKVKFEYSGGHKKEDIIDWLADPQPEKEKEPEKGWDEAENDVEHLTDENFDDFIASNNKVMVFFYAPWCGHCKNLKPHWEEAATKLKEEEAPEKLTAVDATKYNALANKYKVKGYPTIVYFENGEEKYDASGAFTRTTEGIVEYIKDPKEPPPPEKEWHEIESDVHHLSDDDFKSSTKKKKHALIMFYAPWCGHCKKAKPEYTNAAATFAGDKKVMFGAVDCTKQKNTCEQFSVQGYPTFYYLSYGKSEVKYQGGREASDFVSYIEDAEEGKLIAADPEDFWQEFPGAKLLHEVTVKTWETLVSDNAKAIVVVYDPTCPNCQALRKPLIELAENLKKEKIPVAIAVLRVDLKDNDIPSLWTTNMGVPSIFWFENGGKQVEYEEARSAESMMQFVTREMMDRGKEWSTIESAEDIVHLDDNGFEHFIQDQEEALVCFYSPVSCQKCDEIRPHLEETATLLEELKPEASVVAVNVRKAPQLKLKYKVSSTPMFFYFKRGRMKYKYHGKTTAESFVDFMLRPVFIKKQKEDEEWFEGRSNVTHLDGSSLMNFISSNDRVLLMFYAPWCGHCKKFKPAFAKAADILVEKLPPAKLAAINGNSVKAFNAQYNVTGFPTLVYFRNGEFISHYSGKRTSDDVVEFMLEPVSVPEKSKAADEMDSIGFLRPPEVELLDPNNFQRHLDENENVMVMFYAPWCGVCKKAKTPYFDAAIDIYEDLDDRSMAIFNADKHRSFADDFDVKGYPTLWFFRLGRKMYKYKGDLTKEALVEFMSNPQDREDDNEYDEGAQWITENDDVKHLSRENFEKTLKKHENVLVFFYINACQYCMTTTKPKYVEAAKMLAKEHNKGILAAVNGDWEKPTISKYQVDAFPTLLFFKNGKKQYKYEGPTDPASIVKFMKNPSKNLASRRKPASWQDLAEAEYGKVQHLSNRTYDSFLKKYDTVLIMFHSLWYPKCLSLREEFRVASERLPDEIGMGAIDCHRMPEQGIICYNTSVKAFPTFKFYKNGEYQRDFEGTVADDFVLFLTNESTKTRDEL